MIDLRSDTVTKPTPGMLRAIAEAEVGDDVFGEDPTVNAFEKKMAHFFGAEAALFVPSGTMGNQLALHLLAGAGEEVILEESGHIFNYEAGAASFLSSVQLRPLKGKRGKLSREAAENAIRPRNEWDPYSRVIAIENTTNKGGGACYTKEEIIELRKLADQHGLFLHLDGARIWNAMTATGIEPEFFGSVSDTMSICFSKGLGAPVGSMVLATEKQIIKARRIRKMWGGGMRQVGLLAAAAEYAVEHHYFKLKEDHRRAKIFAQAIHENRSFCIDPVSVETNIVLFDVAEGTVEESLARFSEQGIRMVPFGPKTIRATFHFQIGDEDLQKVLDVVRNFE